MINHLNILKFILKGKMKKIKLLELFGGIGSIRKALENLNLEIELIDYVDNWKPAVDFYNLIFNENFETKDINNWEYDKNIEIDLLMHGSPCQDFSNAGKNDLSSGRSILYKKTLEIINGYFKKPKIIIWENVKGLLNKKNIEHFNYYLNEMEKMGYINQWKILNGIDFGIPQRRERVFVVSIHKDAIDEFGHFNFDNLIKTPYRPLAEFLEENVPIDYYISQKSMVKAIEKGKVKIVDNVVQTITTKQMRWNNAGVVMVPLTTFTQENQVHNIEKNITTIGAGGAGMHKKIAIPLFKTKSYKNFATFPRSKDSDLINGSYNRAWKHKSFVGTISSSNPIKITVPINKYKFDKKGNPLPIFIIDNLPYYLRVITPRESWRLMGFCDEHYNAIDELPKTAKYHLAGNSIIVQVLEAILKLLFKVKENE